MCQPTTTRVAGQPDVLQHQQNSVAPLIVVIPNIAPRSSVSSPAMTSLPSMLGPAGDTLPVTREARPARITAASILRPDVLWD